jgi:hypothetical protein
MPTIADFKWASVGLGTEPKASTKVLPEEIDRLEVSNYLPVGGRSLPHRPIPSSTGACSLFWRTSYCLAASVQNPLRTVTRALPKEPSQGGVLIVEYRVIAIHLGEGLILA